MISIISIVVFKFNCTCAYANMQQMIQIHSRVIWCPVGNEDHFSFSERALTKIKKKLGKSTVLTSKMREKKEAKSNKWSTAIQRRVSVRLSAQLLQYNWNNLDRNTVPSSVRMHI